MTPWTLLFFFSDSQISSRGLDPKYIDPVPVTQKVIEGGGMGFFRRKNGEVGVLVRFDDAHWRRYCHDFLFWYCKRRVYFIRSKQKSTRRPDFFLWRRSRTWNRTSPFPKVCFFLIHSFMKKSRPKEVVRLDAFCRCDSSELDKCSTPKKQMDS